jgi:hypothetical protein
MSALDFGFWFSGLALASLRETYFSFLAILGPVSAIVLLCLTIVGILFLIREGRESSVSRSPPLVVHKNMLGAIYGIQASGVLIVFLLIFVTQYVNITDPANPQADPFVVGSGGGPTILSFLLAGMVISFCILVYLAIGTRKGTPSGVLFAKIISGLVMAGSVFFMFALLLSTTFEFLNWLSYFLLLFDDLIGNTIAMYILFKR